MNAEQPTLDYGLAPPSRRRWIKFFVVCAVVAVAIGLATPRVLSLSQKAKRRSPLLAIQSQCMNFTLPTDQVVYEEDHDRAQQLWDRRPAGAESSGLSDSKGKMLAFYARPSLIGQFIDWERIGDLHIGSVCTICLHARASGEGPARTPCACWNQPVIYPACNDGRRTGAGRSQEQNVLDWEVIRPCTRFGAPSAKLASGTWGNSVLHINMPKPLRIYAGQSDPADDSHFTIQATTPQRTLTIEGWLQTNDQIVFSVK